MRERERWYFAAKLLGCAEAEVGAVSQAVARHDKADIRVDELRDMAKRLRELRREFSALELASK